MNFKTFLTEDSEEVYSNEFFTVDDIQEMLYELTQEELQEVGECIMNIIYDEEWNDIDVLDDIDEVHYFKKRAHQVNKEKKKDKSQRRKDAKKRKQWYKKNKAKVKRQNKKYRKKVKRQPNLVRKHR